LDITPQPPTEIRPLWRFLLYLAIVLALWTGKDFILEIFFDRTQSLTSPVFVLLQELTSFAVVYGVALIFSHVERSSVQVYGLPLAEAFGKRFWQGCVFGLCEISMLIGLLAAFGGYSFGPLALHGTEIIRWTLEWTVIFLLVALFEEFAFRGYSLYTLAQSVGFWPAAFLLALFFGYLHSHNPGESPLGEIGVVAIALLFALTLRRTGTLWLAVGWHAAFDFGETFLFSVPDSGTVFPGHLSNATLQGPAWLTGGPAGPEASIFSFLVMALLALAVHYSFPPAPSILASGTPPEPLPTE
jgi:membrane protease YdiL (CAAX protease family)